jgi:hypothetical protein
LPALENKINTLVLTWEWDNVEIPSKMNKSPHVYIYWYVDIICELKNWLGNRMYVGGPLTFCYTRETLLF